MQPAQPSLLRLLRPCHLLVCLAALSACDGGTTQASPGEASPSASKLSAREIERSLDDLVQAVTPSSPATAVTEKNAWFGRRKAMVERLRGAGQELGRAALARYEAADDAIPEVRAGLLDVAAHAAPEETRPVLVDLTTNYGDDLGVRAVACELLGRTSPETAVEVLEPILEKPHRDATYPPEDKLVAAFTEACAKTGHDPVPLLTTILMEPAQAAPARHLAAKTLAEHDTPRSRQALERIVVESGGNHLLRRFAAQSLRKLLPPEEFCAKVRELIDKEADTNFQLFLADTLDRFCP